MTSSFSECHVGTGKVKRWIFDSFAFEEFFDQGNLNSLFFGAKSILTSTNNQRLSWHVNQWNLQEIS